MSLKVTPHQPTAETLQSKKDVIGQEAEEYKASHGSEVAQLWEHLASMHRALIPPPAPPQNWVYQGMPLSEFTDVRAEVWL